MKTARRLTTAAMLFTVLAFATRAQAQADPMATIDPVLKAIPDDALAFAIINDLTKTDGSISKLAALVQAPAPSPLSMLKAMAGIQEGFDENGSAAIALIPDKSAAGAKPFPVIYLPVTDYKKFIAPFKPDDAAAETTGITIVGHAMVVGHKDSFAAFISPEYKAQLGKVIASTKGVDSIVGSFKPWLAKHQISIVGTPTGSKMAFQAASDGLKMVRVLIAKQPSAPQTAQVTAAFDMYDTILTKAAAEVDSLGVGLSLDNSSNLSIDSRMSLVAGGAWDVATKGLKAPRGAHFAGIQAAPFIVAFEGLWPEQWNDGAADFAASMTASMTKTSGGAGMDAQQQKNYADAMRSLMKGLHAMSFVMASPKPGGSMYDGAVAAMKVDDTASFMANYEKSMEELLKVTKGLKGSPFQFSDVKKIEIEGHAGLAITIDMSGMLAGKNDPATAKLMPMIFGPSGKLTMRIFPADDHTLLGAYGTEDNAKEALAAYKNPESSLASDPNVAATLKLLSPQAQWIGLVNIKGYMDMVRGMLAGVAPAGAPINIPELPTTAPIGFAAEANGGGVETQMIVPAATMGTIAKFARQGMNQQGPPVR